MRGKFKASEIALIVAEDCPLIADLNKKFNEKLEQGTKLTIFTYVTNVRGLYRWTHRPSQRGGSCNIDGKDSEIFPYVVLQMNPEEITNKLRMTTDGCKFEGLAAYIDESFLKIKSSDRCPQGTRMTILVIGLDKYLAKLPPKSEVSAFCRVPISQLFDNALAFLLCELGIEFVSLKNASEAADYLHGVTRCLMSEPYRRLDQELDCAERSEAFESYHKSK
jgi:hypothetical protein